MSSKSSGTSGTGSAIDFPPLADEGSWSGLGQLLPSPEQLKESLLVAGGAGGSILLGALVFPRILPSTWHPLARAGIVLGIAVLAGGFVFRFSPQLAVGIIGGLGGLAVATAIGGLANVPVSLGFLGDASDDAAEDAAAALEQSLPEERALEGTATEPVDRPELGEFDGDEAVVARSVMNPALAGAILG